MLKMKKYVKMSVMQRRTQFCFWTKHQLALSAQTKFLENVHATRKAVLKFIENRHNPEK